MFSRFHPIAERNGRTDRQTDIFAISISRVSTLTRDKNVARPTVLPMYKLLMATKLPIRALSLNSACIGQVGRHALMTPRQ